MKRNTRFAAVAAAVTTSVYLTGNSPQNGFRAADSRLHIAGETYKGLVNERKEGSLRKSPPDSPHADIQLSER